MTIESCSFKTERLLVQPWHDPPDHEWPQYDLATFVVEMMTESVTQYLPDSWRGRYSIRRANEWIRDRDNEGHTLLVVERSIDEPVGVLILFEDPAEAGCRTDIRLGYLLAEKAAGKGIATEMLGGLIRWCREQVEIGSVIGGVAAANKASRRVLERHGFALRDAKNTNPDEELLYELRVDGDRAP